MTLGEFLDATTTRFADRPAIVCADGSQGRIVCRTYAELGRDVHRREASLARAGVRPGDRVGVMLSSVPEWIELLFAVTRLGAIFMPINPRFGSRELEFVLAHSRASTLVALPEYLGRDYRPLLAAAARLPTLARIIDPRAEELEPRVAPRAAAADDEATAILFYTSGTTAFPKGVPLTHRNLLPHTIACGELIGLATDDRVLSLYPFFGISGGANKVLSTFAFGACLVFQDAFRPDEALDLLEAERCTVLHAVDVQLRELVRIARERGTRPIERRATIAFMAALDEALARELEPALGIRRFVHAYGMTETNPMVLRNALDDPFDACVRPGGRVAPHAEVRVVDPASGVEQPADVEGEIVMRGTTVMRGYYEDPAATAAAFRDGWFRSGDLGVRDARGFIFYRGRLKDMLKIGGFNVAPQEVEAFLRTHPAIEDVAVAGAADARLGEVVVAFVKLRAGASADDAAIREFGRDRIAGFKMPRSVVFVDALPYHTAANGSKLQRDVLREWASRLSKVEGKPAR